MNRKYLSGAEKRKAKREKEQKTNKLPKIGEFFLQREAGTEIKSRNDFQNDNNLNSTVQNQEVTAPAQLHADLDDNAIHTKNNNECDINENDSNVLCLISTNKESGKNFL